MLWIGSGRDSAITEEVARHTGLEASFALSDSQDWKKKDIARRRVIVLELPASSAFVQDVLATAQKASRPLPVVILDRDRSLNEMLIGPASGLFQHLVGERSADEISASVSAALDAADQKGSFEKVEP